MHRKLGSLKIIAVCTLVALTLQGCIYQSATGPNKKVVSRGISSVTPEAIKVVPLDQATVNRMAAQGRTALFAEAFPDTAPAGTVAGRGDLLAITIWEAPPAALFGGMSTSGLVPTNAPASGVSLPEQMVSASGYVTVPYAGEVRVLGQTGPQIAREIVGRLSGKAHIPQAIVRIIRNGASEATVLGDVTNNMRVPLTPQGERVLDVLAKAGGIKQPVGKIALQITRGQQMHIMPLSQIIADPRQNVMLQPGDVVTALFQPYSFTALGATGKNAEVPFEATGLSLDQAIGRAGGLVDDRSDPRGVFLFRLEDPAALADGSPGTGAKVPVVYRVDLKDPGSYFLMQGFQVRNKDVIFVANSSNADTKRVLDMVSSFLSSAAAATIILP
jgi:polysaccharide biosynthesis/export protein